MAVLKISVLCAVLAMIHIASGTLQLEINPTSISTSLTMSLDLNCTFTYDGLSNFSSIISLIISKADLASIEQPTFTEVLSLNVFASDHVTDFQHHNAIFSGHIGSLDASYIVAHWPYPSNNEEGLYKCEAVGVDNVGHSVQVTKTVLVTSTNPDFDQVINKLNELQVQQLLLQQQIVIQNATINALQAEIQQHEKQQEALSTAMFEKSAEYSDRYYLLSYESKFHSANVCDAYCEYMGGYLAEINDAAEHQFIKLFLSDQSFTSNAYVGGTDEQTEGQWIYRHSGGPLTYTDWNTNQPSTYSTYDCMYLSSSYSWRMVSCSCSAENNCLCEVPTH